MQNDDIPEGTPCAKCNENEAVTHWIDDDGAISLAYAHGMWVPRCMRCVLEEQLARAKELAAKVPELEKQLASVFCEPATHK